MKCLECEKEFETNPENLRYDDFYFCSKICQLNFDEEPEQIKFKYKEKIEKLTKELTEEKEKVRKLDRQRSTMSELQKKEFRCIFWEIESSSRCSQKVMVNKDMANNIGVLCPKHQNEAKGLFEKVKKLKGGKNRTTWEWETSKRIRAN